jgi:MFS family permease
VVPSFLAGITYSPPMRTDAVPSSTGARPRVFYGWTIVGATFVLLFLGFGAAYSFAAFFTSLRDEFDASRGDVSLVFSITAAIYFALGALSGPLADRIGPRRIALAGVGCMSAGLLLASQAQALWQVYLTYSLGVGLGVGLLYVPAIGTVQRWFIVRRGMASGLAVAGIGVGTLVLPPLTAVVIDELSWRWAYFLLAVLSLSIGLAAALLLEHSPGRRGLHPDGERRLALSPAAPTGGLGTREAVTSRTFILLYAACWLTGVGLFIPFAHLAPYAKDHGLSGSTGALLVGFIGAGSVIGRLVLGGFADRLGRRRAVVGAFVGMGLALAWWLVAEDLWSLIVFAFVFGAAYGGYVALVPALTTDYFGGRNAGAIIGILYSGSAVGALIGPTLAGAIYDARGSYALPIAFGVVVNILAVACLLAMRDPQPERS